MTLPLRLFRGEGIHQPRWKRVDQFVVLVRGPAQISIDGFGLRGTQNSEAALPRPDEIVDDVFKGVSPSKISTLTTDKRVLYSTVPACDLKQLDSQLDSFETTLVKQLDAYYAAPHKPIIVVLPTVSELNAWHQLNNKMRETVDKRGELRAFATNNGILAISWEGSELDSNEIIAHEMTHLVLFERAELGIETSTELTGIGNWLHEGLAHYFGYKLPGQNIYSKKFTILQKLESDPATRLPLKELTNGSFVPVIGLPKLLTFIDMLLTEDKFKMAVPRIIAVMKKRNTSDELDSVLKDVLPGISWDELESDWRAFVQKKRLGG